MVLSVCLPSGVHLLKSLKSIFLSLNSSIINKGLFVLFFFPQYKHSSKLMCYYSSIYTQFFQKPVWLMIRMVFIDSELQNCKETQG